MKPNFALNLTDDRISLLHRTGQGWANLGMADFGADDMDARLADMLAAGNDLAPRGITTKVVIPNSQILYTTVEVAPGPAAARHDDIRAALAGRTPYAVEDLAFDFTGDGTMVQVAVVAQETLDQAEDFAVQYQFRPVGFVAIPPDGAFVGEPFFGQTKSAPSVLGKGRRLERDAAPIVLVPEADAAADMVADAPPAVDAFPEAGELAPPQQVGAPGFDDTPADATRVEACTEPGADVYPAAFAPPADVPTEDPAPAEFAPAEFAPAAPEALPLVADFVEQLPVAEGPVGTQTDAVPSTAERVVGVLDSRVPDVDEAPFADVSDTDTPEDTPGDKSGHAPKSAPASADDIPPAPSTAALMAFASRRAAAASDGRLATQPPRPLPAAGETTMPGLVADRLAVRAQANMRPEPRVTIGPAVTAPVVQGGKKARKTGAPAPATAAIAASATTDAPRKPLTKPGGTFASAAPVRGKPRFLGLILTGILILFLALLAAWSSFFLASRNDPAAEPATAIATADAPDVVDEALADGQEPAAIVQDTPEPDATPAVDPAPEADIAGGPDPAPQSTADTAPETAGPAPETGVVTTGPAPAPPVAQADEILLSTADTPLAEQQAASLGAPELLGDTVPVAQMAPPPFGTEYIFNENGTIRAVPEGIMTPDGVRLVAGQPANVPPARPAAIAAAAAAATAAPPAAPAESVSAEGAVAVDETRVVGADPALADARPRARPAGLVVPPAADDDAALQAETPVLASSPRPVPRPAAIVAANATAEPARASDSASLAAASAAAGTAAEAIIQDLAAIEPVSATPSGSRLAVSVSRIPAPRPRDMERAVAAALEAATRAPEPEPEPAPAPEPARAAAAAPEQEPEPEVEAPVASAPTSGSVADQATFVNAMNLSRNNLIGVYGTQSNRYALIRQANGRYKKVEVGDRFDGGVVAAITANEVRYQKGGRLIALQMPDT